MTSSRIDLKRQKSLDSTKEKLSSKTTFFIRISQAHKQKRTHTHTHTSRASLLNEKEKATHEIDLRREVRIIRFSKTRNIVFNIDSSFKK
jgi:hypothetical protein